MANISGKYLFRVENYVFVPGDNVIPMILGSKPIDSNIQYRSPGLFRDLSISVISATSITVVNSSLANVTADLVVYASRSLYK
jgi:hypothetical protein